MATNVTVQNPAPTLANFAPRFESFIVTTCAEKPATLGFYKEKLRRLLDDPKLAALRLDAIDEEAVQAYQQRRTHQESRYGTPVSPASVNREVATLRRLLRLAHEWKVLDRVPRIRMLGGERQRDYVVTHKLELMYLGAAPQPLIDVALLMLDTGARIGEAVGLTWPDLHLQPDERAKFGSLQIREGKSKNAKRNLSLTARVAVMLRARKACSKSKWVFPGETDAAAILGTSLDHQHETVRDALKLPKDFVIHSLRHTMLTRLGEAGADAFTIMRIAGHSSVSVSQRYAHPRPEGIESAFERLESLNATRFDEAIAEAKAAGALSSAVRAADS